MYNVNGNDYFIISIQVATVSITLLKKSAKQNAYLCIKTPGWIHKESVCDTAVYTGRFQKQASNMV